MENKIDAVIIGAQKAGTTSFYDWLAQHDQVHAPNLFKDDHIFLKPNEFNENINSFFKSKEDHLVSLHGGVNYMYFPDSAKILHEYNPNLKIIVILRNPAKRAFSSYLYHRKKLKENMDFRQRISLDLEGKIDDFQDQSNLTYASHGFYYQQLKPYFELFPREQIRVYLFEELIKNKEHYMNDVFEFLNVNPNFKVNYSHKNNTGKTRSKLISKFVYGSNPVKSAIKMVLKPFLNTEKRKKLKENIIDANTVNQKDEEISETDYDYLMEIYKEDLFELEKLIGKSLNQFWPNKLTI